MEARLADTSLWDYYQFDQQYAAQAGIDRLTQQLSRGNLNPGIGTKPIGKGLSEACGSDGARVYFRQLTDGTIEILGKSTKVDQSAVIAEVLRVFGG